MGSEALLKGQADIWKYMYSFADSMALKCAVELRIADIIDSNGKPTTLSQIVSAIPDTPSPDLTCLYRIMRLLVRRKIFTVDETSDGGEPSYGLTPSSKWLLRDADLTLAPMILMENHKWLLDPWHYLDQCVKEGGIAFKKCHGIEIWDFASKNPEFNSLQNEGMACTARIVSKVLVEEYKDGFNSINTLVDVGGGTGRNLAQITKSYPHIKGTNYDLPHVISTAPQYPNVTHVGGNMFQSIPKADAVIIKASHT